ncbi:hypothetical protein OJF2_10340 [Aquisphaera giovannonii]|uniref:Uncharacterized protein n=1 Tax=Aquisphaera giovannonii TaxID=406548 RepID=A0A5B9VX78_9BACT|nr:hypothetical protein [Aquisphaera giovannonii]QEH32557.1 hypothetical protein OJF2_10340 [Aquisphaera giovannonii]
MLELRDKLRRYRVLFIGRCTARDTPRISASWKKAYEAYRMESKALSRY